MIEIAKYVDEERANKLLELHEKKIKLKELLEKQEKPFITELAGLPRTGKTHITENVFEFFKNGGIDVKITGEPAELIKREFSVSEIRKMTSLDFNDNTLFYSKQLLQDAINTNPNLIIMDRGVIDNYFWYQKMLDNGDIDELIYKNRVRRLRKDLHSIDKLYILTASPEKIIERDIRSQIYLEDRKNTTIENVSKLHKAIMETEDNMFEKERFVNIDTDNLSVIDTSIFIANDILDSMHKKLVLINKDNN